MVILDWLCRWRARRKAIAVAEHHLMHRVAIMAPHALYENPWRARRTARRMAIRLVDSGAVATGEFRNDVEAEL